MMSMEMIRSFGFLIGIALCIPVFGDSTRVGVINWDCSLPSTTWFGACQTRSLSPDRYRYLTPYYADIIGVDKIDYHRRTQAEYDVELAYAISAGIDYFAYCWYGEQPDVKRIPIAKGKAGVCEDHLWELAWARKMHIASPLRDKLHLCAIVLGNHVYTDLELGNLARAMSEEWYEHLPDGRPLMYLYWDETNGEIVERVRKACREVGSGDPFVVTMRGSRKDLPVSGDRAIQARSAYGPPAPPGDGAFRRYGEFFAAVQKRNQDWIDEGFDVVPCFAVGRDHWPRIEHAVPWCDNHPRRYASPATERELVEGARALKKWIDLNREKCRINHVLTYAWNEFEEGGCICPLWGPNGNADTSRLEAFSKVVKVLKGDCSVEAKLDDLLPDLADVRKRIPEDIKDPSVRERTLQVLDYADHLNARPVRTPAMQEELDLLRAQFRDTLESGSDLMGQLKYFTRWAYAHADMEGVSAEIDSILAASDLRFREAEALAETRTGLEREMLLSRLEIARRTVKYIRERHTADPARRDLELMAWQGAEELKSLYAYFAAESRRDDERRKLAPPVILNVRDYGAKGDGIADDGPAFRSAILAAKSPSGTPVIVQIPKGVYRIGYPETEPEFAPDFPSYLRYNDDGTPQVGNPEKRLWKPYYGWGFHLPAHGLKNVIIRGEDDVEIRFDDATHGGFGFFGCTDTILKDLTISYKDNPSTQGTIVGIESSPFAFLFRVDKGYPDPDSDRFANAYSRRFTPHDADTLHFKPNEGTARLGKVERVDNETFRLYRPENMKGDPCWNRREAGERISIIARYSEKAKGIPVFFSLSSFSGVNGLTIYDAPGQNMFFTSSYAMHVVDCAVRVRPGSDDLVSSNADGVIFSGGIGPYISGCSFEDMEDDGFNIGTMGFRLESIAPDRKQTVPQLVSKSAFQVDGVTGVIKGFLRRGEHSDALTRIVSPVSTTCERLPEFDMKQWLKGNGWQGEPTVSKPDRILPVPGAVGSVIRNCRVCNVRGMGVQVHSSGMIVENVTVSHATGPGMRIGPLFGWGMLFNVHNVLVRNCVFDDVSTGILVKPGAIRSGASVSQKMIQGIETENCKFSNLRNDAVASGNSWDIRPEGISFKLRLKGQNEGAVIYSAWADRVQQFTQDLDGIEKVKFVYCDRESPVREVLVQLEKGSVQGPKRWSVVEVRDANGRIDFEELVAK